MTATCCPRCGYGLEALEPFSLGSLGVDSGGAVIWWAGHRVPLAPAERLIVVALARADGAPIRRHVLAEVEGYEGDHPENVVAVLVNRINKAFRSIDPGFDRIENIRGAGLRWRVQ